MIVNQHDFMRQIIIKGNLLEKRICVDGNYQQLLNDEVIPFKIHIPFLLLKKMYLTLAEYYHIYLFNGSMYSKTNPSVTWHLVVFYLAAYTTMQNKYTEK